MSEKKKKNQSFSDKGKFSVHHFPPHQRDTGIRSVKWWKSTSKEKMLKGGDSNRQDTKPPTSYEDSRVDCLNKRTVTLPKIPS